MRPGIKFGDAALKDTMLSDGLTDAFNNYHMGITGIYWENSVNCRDISGQLLNSAKKINDVLSMTICSRECCKTMGNLQRTARQIFCSFTRESCQIIEGKYF